MKSLDNCGFYVELNTCFIVEVERGVLSYREVIHLQDLVERLVSRYVRRIKSQKGVK